MAKMLICVPSDLPGGLNAEVSESLEDAEVYNFIEIDDGRDPIEITFLYQRYACHAVACVDPVEAIAKKGVAALIVRAIGPDLMLRFLNSPTKVFIGSKGTVLDSAKRLASHNLKEIKLSDFSAMARK